MSSQIPQRRFSSNLLLIVVNFQEDGEVKSAIQETLALLAASFDDLDHTKQMQMEAVIMQNMEKVNRIL